MTNKNQNLVSIKYVLFICGGKWQLPWLIFLKEKGHKIILVDPYSFSPCVKFSDIHIACDARNIEDIYKNIIYNNYKIEFVTSDQTDVSVNTVAVLSQRLGLLGNNPNIVDIFANKYISRQYIRDNLKNHYPRFSKAYSFMEVMEFYKVLERDIIIKPSDAQSSRGVFKINKSNIGQLESLFNETISFSKLDYIIVEEFIFGKEITVEGICFDSKHYILATSIKKHFRIGIASELRYPSSVNDSLLKKLYEFHNNFINNTGLKFGITHSEYIINEDETDFWLVESACRGGGSLIPSHIVPWVARVDVYNVLYSILTGRKVVLNEPQNHRNAILYFFEFKEGKVMKIDGIEEAKKIDGVLELEMEFSVGDILHSANDDRGRQGYVIIFANSGEELNFRLDKVKETINIVIE